MKQAFDYSLKVWLTSVFAAPFIVLIIGLVGHMVDGVGIALVTFILGMLFSLPCFILLLLACWHLLRWQRKVVIIKAELTLIGILLTYAPFFIINDYAFLLNRDQLSRPFFLLYALLIIFGIWFYTLKPASIEQADIPDDNNSM
jgi:hypothetical protein